MCPGTIQITNETVKVCCVYRQVHCTSCAALGPAEPHRGPAPRLHAAMFRSREGEMGPATSTPPSAAAAAGDATLGVSLETRVTAQDAADCDSWPIRPRMALLSDTSYSAGVYYKTHGRYQYSLPWRLDETSHLNHNVMNTLIHVRPVCCM